MKKYFILAGLFLPALASAHGGHSSGGGFWVGFVHVLSGLDHMIALLAGGVWLSRLSIRGRLMSMLGFAAVFISTMLLGTVISVGPVDWGIVATVVVVLALIMAFYRWYTSIATILLAGAVGLFGIAHGAEMASGYNAILGALISSSLTLIALSSLCAFLRRVTLRVVRI